MKMKRFLSMLMALCMVVSLVPASALPVWAEEADDASMVLTEPENTVDGEVISKQEEAEAPDISEAVKFGTVNYSYTNPAYEGLFEVEQESQLHPAPVR